MVFHRSSRWVGETAAGGIAYPERLTVQLGKVEEGLQAVLGPVLRRLRGGVAPRQQWAARVTAAGREYTGLSDSALEAAAHALRVPLRRAGFEASLVAKVFALVREAAHRALGQRHYDVQLQGGWVLLTGRVAEMETGEGKTLTATLAACTAALAGLPVHVVTVNDYLAARDGEAMGPVYRALGLTVGTVVHGLSPEARQAAYACDVTYCTNKELVFDYLKDRLVVGALPSRTHLHVDRLARPRAALERLLLRGLYYAIVDEADSVLIDEARTPLIIARHVESQHERHLYEQALDLASRLSDGSDYVVHGTDRTIQLTGGGEARLAAMATRLGGLWQGRHRRENLVQQALMARHLFIRDQQYLVQHGKIVIVDEYTGRVMPDRSWERGLHQMIEVKEGCPLSHQQDTVARMSYQRFFRRYLRLAGMTGTATEVTAELWAVYRLGVVRIPTHRPLRRQVWPDQMYVTAEEKWRAVVDGITAAHRQDRPVLVGTRTVGASEHLSGLLTAAGLPHQVLNARQDRSEADVITGAAEAGCITVATNMAGRGTDIRLGAGVVARGGLHVLATERHDARRIDRQLFGRCGRQGDPGTVQVVLSLEDDLIMTHLPALWRRWLRRCLRAGHPVPAALGRIVFQWAQGRAGRSHARMRRAVLKMDEHLDSALAFAGRSE